MVYRRRAGWPFYALECSVTRDRQTLEVAFGEPSLDPDVAAVGVAERRHALEKRPDEGLC